MPAKKSVRRLLSGFILLVFYCLFSALYTFGQQHTYVLHADSLHQSNEIPLVFRDWRFHNGDLPLTDLQPAAIDKWDTLTNSQFGKTNAPKHWTGMGWFAIQLKADAATVGKKLSIRINHDGASGFYIDGRPIGGFGQVGTSKESMVAIRKPRDLIPFWLPDTLPHMLEIRYSNFFGVFPEFLGFQINIGNYEHVWKVTETSKRRFSYLPMSAAAQVILALLHLFLFVFYPKRKINLYYALLVMTMALITVSIYFYYEASRPAWQYYAEFIATESRSLLLLLCCLLLYNIGYRHLPKERVLILWAVVIFYLVKYAVSFFFLPPLDYNDYFSWMFLLFMVDGLRCTFKSTQEKQTEKWLIGAGITSIILLYIFAWSDIFELWPASANSLRILTVGLGMLILPLCLSLYLALQFAKTNQTLTLKLKEVQILSDQALQQEAEKRMLIEGETKRLEEMVETRTMEIRAQAQKLKELDAVKSRFFTNITHEFKTPLTLIINPAQELLAKSTDQSVHYYADLIQKNAQQLQGLINQLLDLSKIESGGMEVETAPLDMIALLQSCITDFKFLAKQKNIRFKKSFAMETLWMDGDRDKLTKIFTNVLSNAIKFTDCGTVEIDVEVDRRLPSPQFILNVRDSGTGIPADKLPYIFERFYTVDYSDSRNADGSGIGLALTKELTDLMGGVINVTSVSGVYTQVRIHLPIKECGPSSIPCSPVQKNLPISVPVVLRAADSGVTDDSPQLLLIEDNDALRQFVSGELSGKYKMQVAENGMSGLKLAQDFIPDIVITDIMMPKMSGYEVCDQLKNDERTSHIPVIMLTAKTGVQNRVVGIQTGADAYLEKPFAQVELEALVDNLIKQRFLLKEKFRFLGKPVDKNVHLPAIEQNFLGKVNAAVSHHLSDAYFGADQLAAEIGLSRTQLHRKLKAVISQSPGELIRVKRLEHAHHLLKTGVANVSEAAYQVGFTSPANFSTSFSRHFNFPPSDLIKQGI